MTSGGGTDGGGTLFEIVPSFGVHLAFTSPVQSLTPGVAASFTVQHKNQYGYSIAASDPLTISLGSSNSSGVFLSGGTPITSVTIPAGSGSVTFQYADTVAGTPTLTASADGVAPALLQDVVTSPVARLVFGVQPSKTTVGAAIHPAVTVEVVDQNSNLLTSDSYRCGILAIASGPGGFDPGSTTTVTVSGGVATFSNLIFDAAGSYTLSETGTGGSSGPNSGSFSVVPVTMNHLSFLVQPSNTTGGSAITPPVKVEVLDPNGNLVTSDNSDQITLTVASGPGAVASGDMVTVSGGVATFSGLILDTPGSYTLAATGTAGLAGANSSGFTVSPPTADHLAFGTEPSSTTASSAINPAVTVEVLDTNGNLITTDNTDQVTLFINSGLGGFVGANTFSVTVSGGIATFGNLTLDTAGSYSLGASITSGLTAATSGLFTVNAAGADHLVFSVQPSNTTAGTAIGPTVKVTVLDKYLNVLTADNGRPITLTVAGGPGTVASGGTVFDSGGIATFNNLTIDVMGSYTLAENAGGGLSGANSTPFNVSAGGIGKLVFSNTPGSPTTAGLPIQGNGVSPVEVAVEDAFGNPLLGDNTDVVTMVVINANNKNPRRFAAGSTTTVTVVNGVASFTNLVLDGAGKYKLVATASGVPAAAQSGSFTIIPESTINSIALVNYPTTVIAAWPFTLTIVAKDEFGNTVTRDPFGKNDDPTVSLASSDDQNPVSPNTVTLAQGTDSPPVTLSKAGTVTLTATLGSLSATTSAITVQAQEDGPSTLPDAISVNLFAFDNSGHLIEQSHSNPLLVPADAQPTPYVTTTTIALNDSQALLFINEEESILGQQLLADGYDVAMITTADPATGTTFVTETPIGETSRVVSFQTVNRDVNGQVTPGTATSFVLTMPDGVSAQADSAEAVTVTALDNSGNVVTDYLGTVTLSSTDPGFGQSISYTFTPADEGSHTFFVYLDTAGLESLTVTQTSSGTSSGQALENGQLGPLASGSGMVTGQGLVDITADAAVNLALHVPGTITASSAEGITVTAVDGFGNVASGYRGTVSFMLNGNSPITGLPASYTFTSTDQGSHTFAVSFKTTGSETITAADDSANSTIPPIGVTLQITPAPAKLLIMNQPPTVVTVGDNFGLVVEAVDSHGIVDTNFNGLVSMTLAANPVHGTLGGVVTVRAVNGIATVSGLTLNKAGAGFTLKASCGSVPAATTRVFTVTTATRLVILTQLSNVAAGSPFVLKVAAEDASGNVISSLNGSVTLSLASGPAGATLGGQLTVTMVKGVAVFSGLTLKLAGTGYSLTASMGALTAATTRSFTVTAGAAKRLAVTGWPQGSVNADSAFGLVVTALDAYGNVANSFADQVTLALASNPGQSTLSGNVTQQPVAGVITFTNLILSNVGNGYKLRATSGKLTAAVTNSFDVAS